MLTAELFIIGKIFGHMDIVVYLCNGMLCGHKKENIGTCYMDKL